MRETYTLSPALLTSEDRLKPLEVLTQLNQIFRRISLRLDQMDGTNGTPTIQNHLNANNNRVRNVADAIDPRDAVSLAVADDRYVQQASGLLANAVIGAVPGLTLDAGSVSVTGSAVVVTRLAQVQYAAASIGGDASINLYPGVECVISGRQITLKTWMPTSNANPTPIASTSPVKVYWLAVGPDLSGGAAVGSAAGGSSPSGSGGTGGGGTGGGGGALK